MKREMLIPVFFSIDDVYAPFLSVTLSSMIENASKEYSYRIIILNKELSEANKEKLALLATEHFEIQFVPMGDRLDGITDRMGNRLRADYFTLTIYFRLFISAMFPEYDKAIYLDSDTVVLGDISELYGMELGENFIGAVQDLSIMNVPQLVKYIEYAIGKDKYQYVNSGVLLMNLKKLREVQFEQRFLELMNAYHFDCVAPDQDYLNVMCHNRIAYLPSQWNTMPANEPTGEQPKLIHYNLFTKPWHYDGVQYQEYFWQYAEDSVFLPEILEIKDAYTDENRDSDSRHMELLLSRGELIADSEINFRTVLMEERKEIFS